MSKLPYMPVYADTYLGHISHLNLEQIGAYSVLINHMWIREGWLPNNDDIVARLLSITRIKWKKLKPAFESVFAYDDEKFTCPKVLELFDKTSEKSQKFRQNAKLGAEKRRQIREMGLANANANGFLSAGTIFTPPES